MSHPQAPYSRYSGGSSRSAISDHDARSDAYSRHMSGTSNHAQETAHAMGGNHYTYNVAGDHFVFSEDAAFCDQPAQRESSPWQDDARYVEVPRQFGRDCAGSHPLDENATSDRTRGPPDTRGQASRFARPYDYFSVDQQSHYGQNGTYSDGFSYGTRANEPHASQVRPAAATHAQQQPGRDATWSGVNQEQRSDLCHDVAEEQRPLPYDSVGYVRRDGLVHAADEMYQQYRSSDYDQYSRNSGSNGYNGRNDASF